MNKRWNELKVGDTITVWWNPGRDTITELKPHIDPLTGISMGYIASFALCPAGMAIEPGLDYEVIRSDA